MNLDDGNPANSPIGYTFEYDKDQRKYSVSRLPDRTYEITDKIRELWEGPCPDASKFIAPGNPEVLLEAFKMSDVDADELR